MSGSTSERGARAGSPIDEPQEALADLPGVLEYTGEFGAELVLFIPFCNWLSRQGLLRARRIKTYLGMRCFYDGLDCLEIIEKDEPRRWVPVADRPAWLPVKNEHDFDGLGRSRRHVYSDLRARFRDFPLLPDIARGKPLLIVHNKHTIEWGGEPLNFIPLAILDTIFRRLQRDFTIVYVRHGMEPRAPGFSEDQNASLDFADRELLAQHPDVLVFDELFRAHRRDGGTQEINLFKNVLYSHCYHFISSQGGGAHHIAQFSGSLLAILHRRGKEENWAYGDGYYGFMAGLPPIRAICRTDDELLTALLLFAGAPPVRDRVVLPPCGEAVLASLSPWSIAERRG